MSANATVQRDDLERTLDYLEGLRVILERLDTEGRGRDASDPLLEELDAMDWFDPRVWEPLRYQVDSGQGWTYVAETLATLRERLVGDLGRAL